VLPIYFSYVSLLLSLEDRDQDCQTINPVNTPLHNPNLKKSEQIEIVDPTHALFGKSFHVLEWRNSPGNAGFAYVAYKHNTRLYIPIEATNLAFISSSSVTKLTYPSIHALISLGKEIPSLCHKNQGTSGKDKASNNKCKS
jgi:hypothetical protein